MTIQPYHNAAPPEYNEKDQPHPLRRWQPGEPLPKNYAPNPHTALERHAEVAELDEQRRRFNDRRQSRPADRKEAA